MIRRLLSLGSLILISCCCLAQTLTKLEGEDAVTLSGLSRNGKYAFGAIEGVGVYTYDRIGKKLTMMEGAFYVDGVSNEGVYVGSETITVTDEEGNYVSQTSYPSYIKDGKCTHLPLPKEEYTDGSARGIAVDGSTIAGYVSKSGEVDRVPCLWKLQSDGTYTITLLPTMEKDATGRTPQGIDILRSSASGDTIIGRMVEYTGQINMPLLWTKNAEGNWMVAEIGRDVVYKEGVTIPQIPEFPDDIDIMSYFTAADSIKYQAELEEYQKDSQGESPESHKEEYISNPDSIAAYNEVAEEYNAIIKQIQEGTAKLNECLTGKLFDVFAIVMSGNGQYMGTVCSWWDPNAEGGDGPIPMLIENKDRQLISSKIAGADFVRSLAGTRSGAVVTAPIVFNLATGNSEIYETITDGIIDGIADNGDVYFATPYMEYTRTSSVIPSGTKDIINFADWIKEKSGGEIDMRNDGFLLSYEYDNYITGERVVVTDSLIVGDVIPSANGRVFLGSFLNPADGGVCTYFIDLDAPAGVKNVIDNAPITVYPNPVSDVLYINGSAEKAVMADLAGHVVYESASVSSIPVHTLSEGIYLLKLKLSGKTNTYKVFVKR